MFCGGAKRPGEKAKICSHSEQKGDRSASNWQKTVSVTARILLSVYSEGDSINCPQGVVQTKRNKVLGKIDVAVLYMEIRLNMGLAMFRFESSQLWCD